MLSRPVRACNGWRGWDSVRPRRPADRLNLGLEVLEPRLLMNSSPMHSGEQFRDAETVFPADRLPSALGRTAEVATGLVPANETAGEANSSQDDEDLDPPSSAPYLVVPETLAFHGTFSTAQWIPDVPYAGVARTLAPGDTIDLYRVDLGSETLALRLAAAYDQASGAPPLRLWVFNALGQMVASATASNGVIDLSVSPGKFGLMAGSALFIGVDSSSSVGASSGVGYQLWFLRLPGAESSSNGPGGVEVAPRGEFIGTVALNSSGSISAMPSNGTSSLEGGVPIGSAALASAQSPALAAAPSGGVLRDVAPTLTVAMATRTVSDLVRPFALLRDGEASSSSFEGPASEGDDSAASALLVALRGPGGFPVLAAAVVGDWQQRRDGPRYPTDDDSRWEWACSSQADECPAAIPVIIAVAASSLRASEPADWVPNAPGAGYATLAAGYALAIDHAQFIDLVGHRPTLARPWPWPRRKRVEKQRKTGHPRI